MHWARTSGQQRDGIVAEADLLASVDEFFECFDGTRSSQASFGSTGVWNWTRSAFSVIMAASSLAAGSVVLALDPPKQPEYSMKARLSGISLDLYYDSASIQKCGLMPTMANELLPIKEVSAKPGKDSGGQPSLAATSLEGPAEECLKAELCQLNISFMVVASFLSSPTLACLLNIQSVLR